METTTSQEHTKEQENNIPEDALQVTETPVDAQAIENEQTPEAISPYATIYDVDNLTELRIEVNRASNEARQNAGGNVAGAFAARRATNGIISQYLVGRDVLDDNPQRRAIEGDLRKYIVTPDYEWSRPDESGTVDVPTMRTRFMVAQDRRRQEAVLDAKNIEPIETSADNDEPAPDSPEPTPKTQEQDPAIAAAQAHLEGLRGTLAGLSAKRQSRLFTLGEGKLSKQYDAAQAEYRTQLQKLVRLELADTLADESLTDTERNATVIAFLFDQEAKLREASLAEFTDASKDSKLNKIGNWLNRGNTIQRLGKGALIGAGVATGAALIGAGLGAAGVAAGAAAAVTAAATASARLVKGYAQADARTKQRGIETSLGNAAKADIESALNPEQNEGLVELGLQETADTRDIFDVAQDTIEAHHEAAIESQRKHRRRDMGVTAAGVAIGAVAGGTLGEIVAEKVGDVVDGIFSPDVEATPAPEGSGVDTGDSDPTVPDETKETLDTDTSETTGDAFWTDADIEAANAIEYDPAFYVEPGQGGISLFQEMGLTEGQWYEVSNELLTQFPQDFYPEGNDVRLAHEGQLSPEAQQYIKQRFGLL